MEKKEVNKEPFNRPDGVEVKLTAKSINIRGFLFFFILFLTGSYLFVYVWDEPSSYINPEKRNVPLYKNDAFQKVQKRRVPEKR